MSVVDWRRMVDVGAADRDGIALEVAAGNARSGLVPQLRLQLVIEQEAPAPYVRLAPAPEVLLDYSDLGHLLDVLREGMGVLLALQGDPVALAAVAGVQLLDTPPAEQPLSDPSDSIRPRA